MSPPAEDVAMVWAAAMASVVAVAQHAAQEPWSLAVFQLRTTPVVPESSRGSEAHHLAPSRSSHYQRAIGGCPFEDGSWCSGAGTSG